MFSSVSVYPDYATFGSVKFLDNSNLIFKGSGNTGLISSNSNLKLFSNNCQLNLERNKTGIFEIRDLKLDCINNENTNLTGTGQNVDLRNNIDSKIFMQSNSQLEAGGNTSSDLNLTGTTLKLINNFNVKIDTEGGNVWAENNVNLRIFGKTGKVLIKNTVNLDIRQADSNDTNGLKISFEASESEDGLFSKIAHWWKWTKIKTCCGDKDHKLKYTAEYVGKAKIDGSNYKLGIFHLNVKPICDGKVRVYFSELDLEPGSIKIEQNPPSEVIMTAKKKGIKQGIRITAPAVSHSDANDTTLGDVFFVNMFPENSSSNK